jgi:hypothetical protein
MRVLLIRTLDLLALLRLVMAGKKTQEEARELLLTNVGWLQVDDDQIRIRAT